MAAFTIGYTPQFIQSDIGAIQKRFADMQSQYDLGYQQSLEAEDAFSAIPTITAEDAAIKEDVLGGFKNRVQGIVDEYGGDYGAAAKRLAKEIISTKSNPFFTAAMLKAQRAEEQRKLASQPGAIILKDVTKTPLRDAQGNYVTADQLDYNVTTRDAIRRELGLAYADLAKKVTEGNYQSVKGIPWLLQKAVTRGITQEEVPAVAENMIATVKQMHPELSDDIAQSIALEQANQLVMGTQTQETSNWQYQRFQQMQDEKDMYAWKKQQDFQPTTPVRLYDTEGNVVDYEKSELRNVFFKEIDGLTKATKDLEDAKKYFSDVKETGKISSNAAQLNNTRKLNSARKAYNTHIKNLSNNYPVFAQMIDAGYKPSEAVNAVKNFMGDRKDEKFKTINYSKNNKPEVVSRFLSLVASKDSPIYKIEKNGKLKETSYTPEQLHSGDDFKGMERRVGFDLDSNRAVIKIGDNLFAVDMRKTDNIAVRNTFDKINSLYNIYSGNEGFGNWIIKNGTPVKLDENESLMVGDNILRVVYDKDKKQIVRDIITVEDNNKFIKGSFETRMGDQLNSIFKEMGVQIEYEDIKL